MSEDHGDLIATIREFEILLAVHVAQWQRHPTATYLVLSPDAQAWQYASDCVPHYVSDVSGALALLDTEHQPVALTRVFVEYPHARWRVAYDAATLDIVYAYRLSCAICLWYYYRCRLSSYLLPAARTVLVDYLLRPVARDD